MQVNDMKLSGPLGVSLFAIAVVVIVLIVQVPSVITTVFRPQIDPQASSKALDTLIAKHDETSDLHRARFDGRSMFYKPERTYTPPPTPPTPIEVVKDESPPEPSERPGPSKIYRGPAIKAIIGTCVHFDRTTDYVVCIGQEEGGIEVLEINAPWTVRVAYQGGEYDVDVIKKDYDFVREESETKSYQSSLIKKINQSEEVDDEFRPRYVATTNQPGDGDQTSSDEQVEEPVMK